MLRHGAFFVRRNPREIGRAYAGIYGFLSEIAMIYVTGEEQEFVLS
jgi:hypothetical protein